MAKRRGLGIVAQTALIQLQEASATGDMLHSNVRSRLDDAIQDQYRSSGKYGYYLDHTGDGEDGDVIFSCSGDTQKAPYHLTTDADGKAVSAIDFDNAVDVVPVTAYQEESDEDDADDHFAAMAEAKLYTNGLIPLSERFVSKKERDAADTEDFAGKGKSYPILKPEDVMAAVRSLGRAGEGNLSISGIKKRIIAIAKRKGWASSLPKAWQTAEDSSTDDKAKKEALRIRKIARTQRVTEAKKKTGMMDCPDCSGTGVCADCGGAGELNEAAKKMKECADCKGTGDCPTCSGEGKVKESAPAQSAGIKLVESNAGFVQEIPLQESARTSYPVKLISPGTGATAHYPAEVLERDGPKIFKRGTFMYWNHPTQAEEADRPEGDLNNLAAILTKDATYMANGPKGPGLYSEAKVMADYAQKVADRAEHIGLSIRASGTGTGKLVEGKPEIKSLDYAESVDYVTKAGRGGMALAESANGAARLAEANQILTEAAPAANSNNNREVAGEMTAEEIKQLVEGAVTSAVSQALATKNQPLIERAVKGEALSLMERELSTVELPAEAKQMVRENVYGVEGAIKTLPLNGDFLDSTKFVEAVRTETKRIGEMLAKVTGGGRVIGMGDGFSPAPVEINATEAARQRQLREAENANAEEIFISIMGPGDHASLAANGVKPVRKAA